MTSFPACPVITRIDGLTKPYKWLQNLQSGLWKVTLPDFDFFFKKTSE